jgi:EmrB/QacA subfamily drug resistance transporter
VGHGLGPGGPDRTVEPTRVGRRQWLALALLALAQFMLIVDITVVQVALPSIGTDLGLDRAALTWVVTAYTLVFGGLMVLGGRLADAFGARRLLLVGLTVFTLASMVCGLAGTAEVLIAGRVGQGAGAAMLSPAALATLTSTFSGPARHRALGVWAAVGGVGAAVGVLLSGLFTAGPGWPWVFFINVPIGVLVFVLLPRVAHFHRVTSAPRHVDVPGALLVTGATGSLIYGLVNAGDAGWSSPTTLLALAAAVVGYALFLVVESQARTPLMRPRTMARRPVVSGSFVMLVATGLLLGLFFLTTLYLQHRLAFSALQTGLLFLPAALATAAGAQAGAHLMSRVGARNVAVAGFTLTAAGAALLTQASPESGVLLGVLPGFVLSVLGVGPAFVVATGTTLAHVPAAEAGVASGVVNTFHELGGSIGVAVISTIAAAGITSAPAASGDGFATSVAGNGFAAGYLACSIAALTAAAVSFAIVSTDKLQGGTGHGHGHGH